MNFGDLDLDEWVAFALQFLVHLCMLAMWIVAVVQISLHWKDVRKHIPAALATGGVVLVWGGVLAVLYGPTSPWLSIAMAIQFAINAALIPVILPIARRWDEEMGWKMGWKMGGALRGKRILATIPLVLIATVIAGALTAAIFYVAPFEVSDEAMKMEQQMMSSVPGVVLMVMGAAFYEELVFRMGFFVFLHRAFRRFDRLGILAAIISSALWALAHSGSVEPMWVKYLQIFPFGILQCVLYRVARGIEAPILTHILFNVGVLVVAQSMQ